MYSTVLCTGDASCVLSVCTAGGGLLGLGLGAAGALIGQQVLNPCGRKRRQVSILL